MRVVLTLLWMLPIWVHAAPQALPAAVGKYLSSQADFKTGRYLLRARVSKRPPVTRDFLIVERTSKAAGADPELLLLSEEGSRVHLVLRDSSLWELRSLSSRLKLSDAELAAIFEALARDDRSRFASDAEFREAAREVMASEMAPADQKLYWRRLLSPSR